MAPRVSECHGRGGGRTDLDGFLLHLVAHVGGLDLGCEARLVLARLRYVSPIGAARAVRWKGQAGGRGDDDVPSTWSFEATTSFSFWPGILGNASRGDSGVSAGGGAGGGA